MRRDARVADRGQVVSAPNNRFEVKWKRSGVERTNIVQGLSELSEFVRNCDAYERELISIEAMIGS